MDPIHRSRDWTGTGHTQQEFESWRRRMMPFGFRISYLIGVAAALIGLLVLWIKHA